MKKELESSQRKCIFYKEKAIGMVVDVLSETTEVRWKGCDVS